MATTTTYKVLPRLPKRKRWKPLVADRWRVLKGAGLSIMQAAIGAAIAWVVARELLGHELPFFAPVAVVITLGVTYGQRGRRAVELALAVAIGIAIGDLIVLAVGTGAWQLALIVALAMSAGIFLGGGMLVVNQVAVSAVLVMTLQSDAIGDTPDRLLDALLGAAIALTANAVVPVNPLRIVRRSAEPLLAHLADCLDDLALSIREHNRQLAIDVLVRLRALDAEVAKLREDAETGQEVVALAPGRRRAKAAITPYSRAVVQIDYAVRNSRVLARGVRRSIETDEAVPLRAIEAIDDIATAVRALGGRLASPEGENDAARSALQAAAKATAALEDTANMSVNVIAAQVRSTAVDLLRGGGMDSDAAIDAVREAREQLKI